MNPLSVSAFDLSFGNSGVQLLRSPLQTLAERKAYDTDLEIVPSRNSHHHLVTAAGHRSQVEVTVTKQEQQPPACTGKFMVFCFANLWSVKYNFIFRQDIWSFRMLIRFGARLT